MIVGEPIVTLSVSPRERHLQEHINPGHNDLQIRNQENPGDPSSHPPNSAVLYYYK